VARIERQIPLRALSVALLAVLCLPLGYLIVRGWDLGPDQARAALAQGHTLRGLGRTLLLGLGVALSCLTLALPLAWLTHATDVPGRRMLRVLLSLPLAVPSYVSAFVVIATFAPGGWLHDSLARIGVTIDVYSTWGTIVALLFTYPFALLAVQAALARTDPRLWESARSLGATPWQAFWRVIFPGLRPALASGGLLVSLYAVGDFGAVSLLRYESLSYLIYVRHKSLFDRHEAVFLALLLTVVASLLVGLLLVARGRISRELSTHGSARAWPVIRLGRWRWPGLIFCLIVLGFGAALPVGVVMAWLIRGLRLGHDIAVPAREALTSLELGASAAVVIVILAMIPALLGRYAGRGAGYGPGKRGGALHVITHAGYALPGIVVALAMVSFATTYMYSLYQTVTLLLIAYVIRFFPLAVHVVDDAVAAQNPGLFLAARSLGQSALGAWRKVVLPGIRPAIVAGLLAVFIAVIKELPVTLLLSPMDFATLATRIWWLTEDAYYSAVAPTVLVLLGIAIAGLLLSPDTRRRRG
jgi:iron(III) transport system permease protein